MKVKDGINDKGAATLTVDQQLTYQVQVNQDLRVDLREASRKLSEALALINQLRRQLRDKESELEEVQHGDGI